MNGIAHKILILGDIHTPFCDWEAITQAYEFKLKHKPDLVISVGDLTDQKSWSRFLKDPQDDNPELEWAKTQKAAKELSKMFPSLTILDSNHDRRFVKKAYEAGLTKQMLRTLDELFPYKGWTWRLQADPVVFQTATGPVAFMHGDELHGSVKAKAQNLGMSVVQGHTHKAELIYLNTFQRQIFALDTGCMIDVKSAAFDYAARYLTKVWVGFSFIQDGIPYLFPKKR